MAEAAPLIDTTIFIEAIKGNKKARNFLIRHEGFYYSVISRKELFQKKGLKASEELKIEQYLSLGKMLFLDTSILDGLRVIMPIFLKKHIQDRNDMIIAATALAKKLSLVTLNRKHFSFIKGLKLISW